MSLHPDGEVGKDALFGSIVPNTNYGDSEDIHLYAWTNSGTPTANRVVMDFNLTTIPEGANIDGAMQPNQSFPGIDATALIQDLVDDRLNSFGMLLRFQYEESYKILMITSSDHPNETLRPRLEVSYTITE